MVGTQLGLPSGTLDVIEQDNVYRSIPCCNAMWTKWLKIDPSASWEKLLNVIESLTVPSDSSAIFTLSNRLKQLSIHSRFAVDEQSWPPNQPKEFTPLLLIHHQGKYTFEQATALQLAKSTQSGNNVQSSDESLRKALDSSKTTKQLVDILALLRKNSSSQFILVEGLPGIGKSLLLQEIAYNWAKGKLLQEFELVFLVQLRNPAVQQLSLVSELFRLVCIGDTDATEIATECSKYFFKNGGNGIVFLFDGYDEIPENHLQKESLITSILKRQVLPYCGLVVSSRPHASVKLRQQATVKVDILGFAKEERILHIEQSLKEQPHAVKEITEYLESNVTIDSLCFIPFNMVILMYLYEQGIPLPSNTVKLYNYFICITICRHLAKLGHSLDNTITDLFSLPEPYSAIVMQLSKLSLIGLNNNKLIFSLAEVKETCPDITASSKTISGFGLLQAVQHFGLTGKTITFNFVHFSIQEFLAAYYITQLPHYEELQVLKSKFWSDLHSNMFAMYISLTKGQKSAFKQYLSGGNHSTAISEIFLTDQLKCVRLFRCFYEAEDGAMYRPIQEAKIFNDKVLDLNHTSLSPYDVECVTLFLACSPHKRWKELNFFLCNIQDHGLHVLHRDLMHSDITIEILELSWNNLTRSSSSFISDITIHCRVEELVISCNGTIGEELALYSMLSHPSSKLLILYILGTKLTAASAINLFTALAKGNKLKQLYITNNNITDEACDVIATTLENNTSLVKLWMSYNEISAEAAKCVVQALHNNNTIQVLELPYYPKDVKKKIRFLQEAFNQQRESRGCQTKLNIDC